MALPVDHDDVLLVRAVKIDDAHFLVGRRLVLDADARRRGVERLIGDETAALGVVPPDEIQPIGL